MLGLWFSWIGLHGFCHTGPISLCVDLFVFMCLHFVFSLYWICRIILTRCDGSSGIEVYSLGPYLPSVFWHCWLSLLSHKNQSPMWPIMCLWDVESYSTQSRLNLVYFGLFNSQNEGLIGISWKCSLKPFPE